jgi:hypothetical protein
MELPRQLLVHPGNVRSFGENIIFQQNTAVVLVADIHVGIEENNEKRSVHVLSKYSDSLRGGRCGHRILVARFSAPLPALGHTQTPIKWAPGHSGG